MHSEVKEARFMLSMWIHRTIYLGIATAASVASVIPFLQGFLLHKYFEVFGKYLIYIACSCFTLFMWSVGMMIWWLWYWRTLERENRADKT